MAKRNPNRGIFAGWIFLFAASISLAITPAFADVIRAGAAASGSADDAVTRKVGPEMGRISPDAVYPATDNIHSRTTVHPTLVAQANTSVPKAPPQRLDPNHIRFTTQTNGLQSIVFDGTEFNYLYGEGLLSYVSMRAPNGPANWTTPNQCSGTFDATSVTKTCFSGSDPLKIRVVYSVPASGTIRADIHLTNQSPTNTVAKAVISTLGVRLPLIDLAKSRILAVDELNPVAYANYGTGRFALWTDTPGPNFSVAIGCAGTICKNQPSLTEIGPGASMDASYSIRFSNDISQMPVAWVPEAYAAYSKAYPSIVNWPDRRPILAWFIADHSHQSATNPRGYLNDPTLNVNQPGFQAKVLAQAQSLISSLKSRPVQPQGIVIWDLEGQEFIHSTTYVGDPRVLSKGYAPEMNATADQLFALFRNAGLKVGLTLRPQSLQWGPATRLPTTCRSDPKNHDYWDFYIAVDAPFGKAYYGCSQTNTWTQYAPGNGGQTFFPPNSVQEEIELLMAKTAYAHSRWGTTLYYVDTSVWSGGAPIQASIFRALQKAFPDSLFIPEQSSNPTMAVTMPYSDPKNSSAPKFAPLSWRFSYPTGALGIYLGNCTGACWTANLESFRIGQKVGDIPIYAVPGQTGASQLNTIEGMILQARQEASSINVTDSSTGTIYSYSGKPSTVSQYPLKMRVYFAATPAALPASDVYCESGGWLGENACTLDLRGMSSAQVRYYSFMNQPVAAEAVRPR